MGKTMEYRVYRRVGSEWWMHQLATTSLKYAMHIAQCLLPYRPSVPVDIRVVEVPYEPCPRMIRIRKLPGKVVYP